MSQPSPSLPVSSSPGLPLPTYTVEAVRYDGDLNATRAEVWDRPRDERKDKRPCFASESDHPVTDCRLWAQEHGSYDGTIVFR